MSSKVQTANMEENDEVFCYVLVGNIPLKYRTVDLRSFFSQFTEAGKFECFHFRHRPEVLQRKQQGSSSSEQTLTGKTTCCVVRLKKEHVNELVECYHGENWVDKDGKLSSMKTVILNIAINDSELHNGIYQSRKEKRDHKRECVEFVKDDLLQLSELHPPLFMPNGNVGTNLNTFMKLIRTCQLPPQVIKKLGLSFPSGRSKHRYGNVCFDYGTDDSGNISLCTELEGQDVNSKQPVTIGNSKDDLIGGCKDSEMLNGDKQRRNVLMDNGADDLDEDCEMGRDDEHQSEDSESEAEEDWERHEALHDDVDCQGRTKERLFENKIELKWEKGGSGLVFYTDAAYWDKLNGDFDEQTADDWDIDMGVYDKEGTGDRHSKQLLQMRIEEQRWAGEDVKEDRLFPKKVGEFEKHTKGFASSLMKKQGWSEGTCLGGSQVGIKEPIPNEGQHPRCKKGLGYYGEKLNRHVKRQRVEKDVVISTIFDKTEEKTDTPLQSAGPFTIKYRSTVNFVQPQQENHTGL